MENTLIFKKEFEGSEIFFDFNQFEGMLDMTSFIRASGKRLRDFTRLKEAKEYIVELGKTPRFQEFVQQMKRTSALHFKKSHDFTYDELYNIMIQTGRGKNTFYIYRPLAIRVAQWLSPKFAIWVDETIEKLIFGKGINKIIDFNNNYGLQKKASDAMSIQIEKREKVLGIDVVKSNIQHHEEKIAGLNLVMREIEKSMIKTDPNQTNLYDEFSTNHHKYSYYNDKIEKHRIKLDELHERKQKLSKNDDLQKFIESRRIASKEMERLKKGVTLNYIRNK